MNETTLASAQRTRALLLSDALPHGAFRAELTRVPTLDRDAWVNCVLAIDAVPDDSVDLPPDGVPYWPSSVDSLLKMVERAAIEPSDVIVDVGSGAGRAAVVLHLLTHAAVVGFEVQKELVEASRILAASLNIARFEARHGDAESLVESALTGSVFFFYCPFGRERLERVVDRLEAIARTREIRVCFLDTPIASRAWLALISAPDELAVYRSTLLDGWAVSPGSLSSPRS